MRANLAIIQLAYNQSSPRAVNRMEHLVQVVAIETLVDLGCNVSVKDSVNSTPVHVAAGEGHMEAVAALHRLVR